MPIPTPFHPRTSELSKSKEWREWSGYLSAATYEHTHEREYGLPEGSINHGQMALDQMLTMRPIPGYARYRSPVEGLYFCGAGAHPGGGVTGAPGRNAARVIARDLRRN